MGEEINEIDPLILKGLWDNSGETLEQVTLESGRYYKDTSGKKYYSVSTVLDKTMHPAKRKALDDWRASLPAGEADLIKNSAASRGTQLHMMVEQYLLRGYQLPDEEFCCGEAYQLFQQYHKGFLRPSYIIPRLIEGKTHYLPNGKYGYAGTVDLVADIQLPTDAKPILTAVDHKSINNISKASDRVRGYKEQLAGYIASIRHKYGDAGDIQRGIINFVSTRGFRQYVMDFAEIEEFWGKFHDKLERFYVEELWREIV